MAATPSDRRTGGVAFLLAQLGQHATSLFADRIAVLDLSPPQAGILRAVAIEPGRSQQALSEQLGLLPSRMVVFVDELEHRGCLERRRHPTDRRQHALHLTPAGDELMRELSVLARQHEQQLTAGLSAAQRTSLMELLTTMAARQGLVPGVHPGYRSMGRANEDPSRAAGG